MRIIKLPLNWSAKEARAVHDFLEEIRQQIYHEYAERIEELCREECWEAEDSEFGDTIEF
ncbi:MAG: hypothetical protein P8Y45_23185 [Exilibacterium sp.]